MIQQQATEPRVATPELFTTQQVARMAGVSRRKLYIWQQRGELPRPALLAGNAHLWSHEQVEAIRWLAAKTLTEGSEPYSKKAVRQPVEEISAIREALRGLRQKAGLTTGELGALMGKSQPAISLFETRGSSMYLDTFLMYCKALKANPVAVLHEALRTTDSTHNPQQS